MDKAIVIWTRHTKACRAKLGIKPMTYHKCGCPKQSWDPITRKRVAMNTRNMSQAQGLAAAHPAGAATAPRVGGPVDKSPTAENGVALYLEYCRNQGTRESSIERYKTLLDAFARYFPGGTIGDVTLTTLRAFYHARMKDAPGSCIAERGTLKQFWRHCVEEGWATVDHGDKVKRPHFEEPEPDPFDDGETDRMLAAVATLPTKRRRLKARALLLLLEHSGMRISDAVRLRRDAIDMVSGRFNIVTIKNHKPVSLVLPRVVVDALAALPNRGVYFLSTETSTMESATKSAQSTVRLIRERAGLPEAHCHQYRHTFVVRRLAAGWSYQRVAEAIGDTSATVEEHYSGWTKGRQKQLDEANAEFNESLFARDSGDTLPAESGTTRGGASL